MVHRQYFHNKTMDFHQFIQDALVLGKINLV